MQESLNIGSLFFNKFPILEAKRIILTEIDLADVDEYYKMMSDPKVIEYLSPDDIPNSLAEARHEILYWKNLFHTHQSISWKIANKQTQRLIGTIGFNSWNIENRRAEVSYELASEFWQQGIMTEVLSAVIPFAFEHMKIHRIEARTLPENIASQKLLEKLNFKKECIQKSYRIIAGTPRDVVLYSIINIQ